MNKVSRVLGLAFLFQAVTSLVSGAVLEKKWLAEGDINATLNNIAGNPGWLRANIFVDFLTALGVIFLGAALYVYLKKYHNKLALVGMSFFILEGALIAASRIQAFHLFSISKEYAALGQAAGAQAALLQTMGTNAYNSSHYIGMALSMLAFCAGAIPLYYTLTKSNILPKWFSLLGLVTVFPCLAGTLMMVFGYNAPFAMFAPYVPFEFAAGIWILVKGVPLNTTQKVKTVPAEA